MPEKDGVKELMQRADTVAMLSTGLGIQIDTYLNKYSGREDQAVAAELAPMLKPVGLISRTFHLEGCKCEDPSVLLAPVCHMEDGKPVVTDLRVTNDGQLIAIFRRLTDQARSMGPMAILTYVMKDDNDPERALIFQKEFERRVVTIEQVTQELKFPIYALATAIKLLAHTFSVRSRLMSVLSEDKAHRPTQAASGYMN
jgi:hypothetical protein